MNTQSSDDSKKEHGPGMSVFLSREFTPVFLAISSLLLIGGISLVFASVWMFLRYADIAPNLIFNSFLGAFLSVSSFGLMQARKYLRRREMEREEETKSQSSLPIPSVEEIQQLSEEDFEGFDRVKRVREAKDEEDFKRNLTALITVESFSAQDIRLFPKIHWKLQPGNSTLLGRNGYGKSLILRALAGALQRDEVATEFLFPSPPSGPDPRLDIVVKRDGETFGIRRTTVRFAQSLGKVPLLAIPDSRFFDRSQEIVPPEDQNATDLRSAGAYHFLYQKPYSSVVKGLLYEICLDYWEHNRDFKRPVFQFLEECVRRLTNYEFHFHSIERKGRTGFEIRVITEGNDRPLRIQDASQGTLSVLAMFGLIRSYLRTIAPDSEDSIVQKGSGIVLIDEADAHLHPTWQQKVPTLLKELFPKVQFILAAHSPLFVAGCWNGEVAVVRRAGTVERETEGTTPRLTGDRIPNKWSDSSTKETAGFAVEQLDRDFVGATAAEIYKQIFDIEELDDTYLANATKATLREEHGRRINAITNPDANTEISPEEKAEADALLEENRRIRRAMDVNRQRREGSKLELRIDELEFERLKLKTELAKLKGREETTGGTESRPVK